MCQGEQLPVCVCVCVFAALLFPSVYMLFLIRAVVAFLRTKALAAVRSNSFQTNQSFPTTHLSLLAARPTLVETHIQLQTCQRVQPVVLN